MNHNSKFFISVFVILIVGCGPSDQEKNSANAKSFQVLQQERSDKIETKINELETKYNAVYFPPIEYDKGAFTYEMQKYFQTHANDTIVFEGSIYDIEVLDNKIIVEFVCEVGFDFLALFRLDASEKIVRELLKSKPDDLIFERSWSAISQSHYVTAKINNIKKIRRYEFDTSDIENESIGIHAYLDVAVYGELVDAIPIRNDDGVEP